MKRAWTWMVLIVGAALIAGLGWYLSVTKFEIRLQTYEGEEAVPASAPPVDPILQWMGWGLLALFLAAVAFTAWAVVKQILLIRRGRPDSR